MNEPQVIDLGQQADPDLVERFRAWWTQHAEEKDEPEPEQPLPPDLLGVPYE